MKNKALIVILIVFVVVIASAVIIYPKLTANHSAINTTSGANSDTDQKAYDFNVYDSNMNEAKLSDNFGKPIVINFWAMWCGPCKSELPAFDAMYEKYGDEVVFMMVNLTDGSRDTKEGVDEFVDGEGYSFPVYYDMDYDASNAYGVQSIPETVFINSDGSVYETQIGAMDERVLENYIENLLEKE